MWLRILYLLGGSVVRRPSHRYITKVINAFLGSDHRDCYPCPFCGYECRSRAGLVQHIARCHSIYNCRNCKYYAVIEVRIRGRKKKRTFCLKFGKPLKELRHVAFTDTYYAINCPHYEPKKGV